MPHRSHQPLGVALAMDFLFPPKHVFAMPDQIVLMLGCEGNGLPLPAQFSLGCLAEKV